MPTRAVYRGKVSNLSPAENSAPFFVDSDDNQLKLQPNGAGDSTEVVVTALPATAALVTQTGTIGDAVTLNATRGRVVTVTATTASAAENTFTVNNSTVGVNSVVVVAIADYTGSGGDPIVSVTDISTGSFDIVISNLGGVSLDAPLAINFAVL